MWTLPAILGWIASGLPFDCNHAVFNFLLCLFLYRPLRAALEKLQKQIAGNRQV